MEAVDSVERQIRDALRASALVTAVIVDPTRIVDQPLKRAGSTDATQWANDPTPQCFRTDFPFWLHPSLSVSSGQSYSGMADVRSSRYIVVRYTLAYYAGPDVASVVLWQMRTAVMKALFGMKVVFPDGNGAQLRPVNDLSSIVDVPEFPGSGNQMMERVSAYGVWRRT